MFALISSRSGSQSAMLLRWALQGHHGPLVYISARHISGLFPDDNLSKYQSIFTKFGMCVDIMEICFRIANGQIYQGLTELSARFMIVECFLVSHF